MFPVWNVAGDSVELYFAQKIREYRHPSIILRWTTSAPQGKHLKTVSVTRPYLSSMTKRRKFLQPCPISRTPRSVTRLKAVISKSLRSGHAPASILNPSSVISKQCATFKLWRDSESLERSSSVTRLQ